MDGQTKYQPTKNELDKPEGHRNPMINPEELPTPLGILSVDDGVVVYANKAFREIIKSTKVGEPVNGFLHTPTIRNSIAKKLQQSPQYITLLERPQVSLRFTITKDLFLDIAHYFVCIEKVNNIIEKNNLIYQEKSLLRSCLN